MYVRQPKNSIGNPKKQHALAICVTVFACSRPRYVPNLFDSVYLLHSAFYLDVT